MAEDLEKRRQQERAAVEEAGGGVAEGFEQAEDELIEHASHADSGTPSSILDDAGAEEAEMPDTVYGEADDSHLRDN
jgi:uncharacterized protein HemY